MHQINIPMDYHVWSTMLERYKRHTPNVTNIAELKTAVLMMCNDLPQISLTLKPSYHVATDFDWVLLQLVDILNALFED